MLDQFVFHDMTFTWLESLNLLVDGGRLFGPVPKVVWYRFMPSNDLNQVQSCCDPILLQYQGKNILIEASLDLGKMDDKQKRNEGIVPGDNRLFESLKSLDLTPEDIDIVLLTHMHNDHVGGLVQKIDGELVLTFPKAHYYLSQAEWEEVTHPTSRTQHTYLEENWRPLEDKITLFEDRIEVLPGIEMIHMGGHTKGLSLIQFTQAGEKVLHMSDNCVTHVHTNPNWVGAVDDYPMDTIAAKVKYQVPAYKEGAYFIFYHDPYYRMVQYDETGKFIRQAIKCQESALLPYTEKQDKKLRFIEA